MARRRRSLQAGSTGAEDGADDTTPDSSDRTTAVPAPGQSAPPALRLRLDPTLARGGILDGGRWPRSRDPEAELPALIAGLESSLGATTRVALNPDAWDSAPRQVAIDGRCVHVSWFRAMNPHTVGLTRAFQDRFVLLVVPAQATTMAAATAMAMAADADNSARPADLLAASAMGAQDTAPIPAAAPTGTRHAATRRPKRKTYRNKGVRDAQCALA
jgi:Family of unknown function (DUF5994)